MEHCHRESGRRVRASPGLRAEVEGRENLESLSGPAVFVANHASHLDTPLIFGGLPRPLASRLAVGAADDYFFTSTMTGMSTALLFNAFPVQRSGTRRRRRSVALSLLDEGWNVLSKDSMAQADFIRVPRAALPLLQAVDALPSRCPVRRTSDRYDPGQRCRRRGSAGQPVRRQPLKIRSAWSRWVVCRSQ
ncbi:1-acyl-sn-glycerol-3-phosphate acyltransferase [Streptomyces sp. NPDC005388]|uniref:1-acyl-sn-glycerol-3-phosphate acyltransferase n=1 Tax=Streptomyces sp. NPDC005388 TaxID=3156717 RepID=UPI0033A8AE7F